MHRLSITVQAAGLAFLLAACETPMERQDPGVSSAKGANLVFETVCMPVILDGEDFVTLAKSRMMVAMDPDTATRGPVRASQTFRLGVTGVTAALWEDGSCTVGAELGDSDQLQAQALASLQKRGLEMSRAVSGRPAVNDGAATAYCSPDPRPVILVVTTPASESSKAHALMATLFRAKDEASDTCLRPPRV